MAWFNLVATAVAFVVLWRRLDALEEDVGYELSRLESELDDVRGG